MKKTVVHRGSGTHADFRRVKMDFRLRGNDEFDRLGW